MSKLEQILEYNKNFIDNKDYEKYVTTKIPKKKIAILTCMDTRLTELLPKAMNIKNGDAKIGVCQACCRIIFLFDIFRY